jgi:MFS family permease
MPTAYGRLLRTAGAPRLAASLIALGLASTMAPVGFVLFARNATGSFGTAGLVLAASTAGGLLLAPLRGRLVDRIGPRAAILRLALPSAATDLVFIAAGLARWPAGLLVVLAGVAGAITPPAGAAVRVAWNTLFAAEETRHPGYALQSMLGEVTFISGPLLAGLLVALGSPAAAVAGGALLNALGALVFATSAAARAAPATGSAARPARLPALAGAGMRGLVATALAFGATFGTLDIALPTFARQHGQTALAGILLSALAAGVGLGGLLYGLRPHPPARERFPRLCLLAAAGLAPLILAPALAPMVGLAFVSGLAFAPITVTLFGLVDELAAPGHRAEAMTWVGTANGAGSAAGAALSGQLGLRVAFAAACCLTALTWLISRALIAPGRDSAGRP